MIITGKQKSGNYKIKGKIKGMEYLNLFNRIEKESYHWKTEAEVRKGWLKNLDNELDINFKVEEQRNDAHHNQIIIEFKNKSLFNGKVGSAKYNEAIFDRLKPYILKRAKIEGLPPEDYVGIATDGDHIVFAHIIKNEIYPQDLMPFSEASISKVAIAIKQNNRRALTAENLIEDFGHNSIVGIKLMKALSNELTLHLNDRKNNKIKMLFEEWRTLFGQIANLSSAQIDQINKILKFPIPNIDTDSIPGLLFIIHTYNALIMKFLGAEILSYYDLTQHKNFCENLASQNDIELLEILENDIERGHFFERVGIKGFIEEAIFSWYLDVSKNKREMLDALRSVLINMSLFRIDNLTAARSRDVLKGFYQSLVPDTMRKSLGEFYTPDWLVDITADKANISDWLSIRVLDPTCGSGSFLLNAVARKRKEAEKLNWDAEKTLDHLLNNVWGFDLNPLAVQASRVNFLISIADLIKKCKSKTIELPILLADSVYSPAEDPDENENTVVYKIGSVHADLEIILPSELAFDRKKLDNVFEQMGESVDIEEEFKYMSKHLLNKLILTKKELLAWKEKLALTYNRVLDLHKQNWNGIWFRIVRNFFWSATAGQFDLILGNPPWVRWSSLPEDYREKIKPTCQRYEIFSDTPFHGGNELDISGMITYTVADKWLKENGKLAFVIPQTHFQSASSQGFRSFEIDKEFYLNPVQIEDLKILKPFPDAANKTAIAVFEKVKSIKSIYPVIYNIWETKKGYSRSLAENSTKDEILKTLNIIKKEANPVDGFRSPWAIMSPGKFETVKPIRGKCDWIQGRKGITADLNGIYFIEIIDQDIKRNKILIQTRPQAGRNTKDLIVKRYWVEPDLLYPLFKGASDFSKCFCNPRNDLYVFVPNNGITKKYLLEAEEKIENQLIKTKNYFNDYETLLKKRSTYKARLSKYAYYSIYNVGEYTFSPYKVVWAEQSGKFEAAVISGKEMPINGFRSYVPDHKIYFVDFQDETAAYYLCGLLTSPTVCEFIESHTISIQVSNIFKHLKLPIYNSKDKNHKLLARLVKKAHCQNDIDLRIKTITKVEKLAENLIFNR